MATALVDRREETEIVQRSTHNLNKSFAFMMGDINNRFHDNSLAFYLLLRLFEYCWSAHLLVVKTDLMFSVKEAQKWSCICLYSPWVPILWIRRWTNPCPRCHTVLWGLFFCPTISCLLLITRFSRTWVGLWQRFRLRHQRHPHLMWKSHW